MLLWSEFSCVSGTIFVFSVPALHPPPPPSFVSPGWETGGVTWTCSSQLPISLLLHPRRGFPPVPARSACRGLCRLLTPHLVFFSCSSSVSGPWESRVPAPAVAFVGFFFFSPLQFLLLFVPPLVFSLKIFCHLPLQLFFTLDFPVLFLFALLQFR